MGKDRLFHETEGNWTKGAFEFDSRVANVFDDMVSRSVPGYASMQLLIADLALKYYNKGIIYDLGCSTGNTIRALLDRTSNPIKIIGIDNSQEMIDVCLQKLQGYANIEEVSIKKGDIENNVVFEDGMADVVILNLVLQFIRPLKRLNIIKNIYANTRHGGCLVIVEKTVNSNKCINNLFIDYYHRYKREMGYSAIEITRKREALENVLIPFTIEENVSLLREAGYSDFSTFFQWMNFSGFVAIKDAS